MKKKLITLIFLLIATLTNAQVAKDTTNISFTDLSLEKKISIITTHEKGIDINTPLTTNEVLKELGVPLQERDKIITQISDTNEVSTDSLTTSSEDGIEITIITTRITDKELSEDPKREHVYDNKQSQNDIPLLNENKMIPNLTFFPKKDFGLYLGLNSLMNSTPIAPYSLYHIRNWKSRYIALSFRKNHILTRNTSTELVFSYGPEIAIYNFRFKNNNRIQFKDNQVSFEESPFETKKSKLTVSYLNLPLMLNIGFKKSKLKMGIGTYIGYKIGSKSKTRDLDGNTEKIKGNYGLNNLLTGITAEIGKKDGLNLFIRYDMNELFKPSQINANNLKALSFGVRL